MAEIQTVEQLAKAGGKAWEKNGMTRVYFNDLARLYGLKLEYYGSGSISTAWLDGEKISNSLARRMLASLGDGQGKLWYDFSDKKFHYRGIDDDYAAVLVDSIKTIAGGA